MNVKPKYFNILKTAYFSLKYFPVKSEKLPDRNAKILSCT